MFENPRRGRQARNFGKNVPKILDLKLSSEQIFSENCHWVPLISMLNQMVASESGNKFIHFHEYTGQVTFTVVGF